MEFHQLRYFVATAELLNMSRAAEQMHVSQPALSRQIALLEDEIGVPLFDRIKKRIHLTEAGRFFLHKARQLLCDSELSVLQIREQFAGARRTLRLGFISPFLDDLVAPAVREFQQRHPNAQVSLFDLSPRAQLDRLKLHEIDAAILANVDDATRKQFSVTGLSTHRMSIVLPSDHRLAHSKSIPLKSLKSESWVSLSDTAYPGRREFFHSICRAAHFAPKIVHDYDSLSLMLAAITTGNGIGLMPQHASKIPHAGCVFISLTSPRVTTQLLLVTSKESANPQLASLIALIVDRSKNLQD
jgi:DNA-binding transcriptional LysR family regulator